MSDEALNRAGRAAAGLRRWSCLALAGLVVGGCSGTPPAVSQPSEHPGQPVVAVVNYPLAYFTERLAGAQVAVAFPAPADVDPAFWEPADDVIASYQKADLLLLNGADYGQWLRTATLPDDRLVDTSRAFADAYLRNLHAVTHSHGPQGAHEHGSVDFNTWLDPVQAARQVEAVRSALTNLLPSAQAIIAANFKSLATDLQALDDALTGASRAWGDRPLLASHPVYGYLARRYGWKLESVHWEPNEMPPESEWTKLRELMARHPATIMIWEDQPLDAVSERLRSLGIKSVIFRPCGNRPPQGDYLSEMKHNAARLKAAALP